MAHSDSSSQPTGQKYTKSGFSGILNVREVKAKLLRATLGRLPKLSKKLHYYPDLSSAHKSSRQTLYYDRNIGDTEDFGVYFSEEMQHYMALREEAAPALMGTEFSATLHSNATILGHTGVAVIDGSVIAPTAWEAAERNYARPARLKEVIGDRDVIYIPMLGVRRGHRQYFHFFAEYLTTLHQYIMKSHHINKPCIIVTRNDLSEAQEEIYAEIIRRFPGFKHVMLDEKHKLLCPRLLCLEYKVSGKSGAFFSPTYITFLNDLLSQRYRSRVTEPYRKIFLSRRDAKLRHLINEDAVESFLHSKGFETVSTAKMSLKEQFTLFSETKTLVTTHGAGLTNILFMQPGAEVIEMASEDFGGCAFMWISAAKGLTHRAVIGGKEQKRQHYMLPVESLQRFF